MLRIFLPRRLRARFSQPSCCASYHSRASHGQNHYTALGIPATATQSEIKSAYFNLCKEYHPDRHSNNKSKSEKFLRISDAYTVLSNVASRREYDAALSGLPPPARQRDRYYREQWSSAYRSNPYVRNRARAHRPDRWDEFYNNARQRDTNSHQWNPQDQLGRYWSEFYRGQRSQGWQESTSSGDHNQPWIGPDRLVSLILAFVVTMLVLRFMVAAVALRSRTEMQQYELERHMNVQRQVDEAKNRLKMQPQSKIKTHENLVHPVNLEDT